MKKPGKIFNISTLFVVLAALFWGISGGIGGILIADGWDAFVVSFYRGAIGLLFVLAWLVLQPGRSGLASRKLWFWSAVAGLGVAGNFGFYFLSIEEGSVAVAATLMYCAPVFVYLASFALRLEKPTAMKLTAITVVMVGIFGIFLFCFKNSAPHGSPQAILSIAFAVLALVLIWPAGTDGVVEVVGTEDWPLFAVLGVLGAGLSFIIYIMGLNWTAPAVASIVAMVEPVTASLFGVLVLSESLALSQLVGMGLILVTVTALSITSSSGRTPIDFIRSS